MKSRLIGCDTLARVYPPDLVDALRGEAGLDPAPLSAADLRVVVARPASMGLYVWLIFRII